MNEFDLVESNCLAEAVYHKFNVSVSDKHSDAISQRREKIQKFIRVKANESADRKHTASVAKKHFEKRGYKVHDVDFHSEIKEAVLLEYEKYKDEHGVTWNDEGDSDRGHTNWGRGPRIPRKPAAAKTGYGPKIKSKFGDHHVRMNHSTGKWEKVTEEFGTEIIEEGCWWDVTKPNALKDLLASSAAEFKAKYNADWGKIFEDYAQGHPLSESSANLHVEFSKASDDKQAIVTKVYHKGTGKLKSEATHKDMDAALEHVMKHWEMASVKMNEARSFETLKRVIKNGI